MSSNFLGVSAMAASALHSLPPSADSVARDSRQNKKSKWDKVYYLMDVVQISFLWCKR